MLDKVGIGALVAAVVTLLGVFGIDIPEDISNQIVGVIVGLISTVTYFATAFFVKERKQNADKLKFR